MKKIIKESDYFNIETTLNCGQVFRYERYERGYIVYTGSRMAYLYYENSNVVIECEDCDAEFFASYFDLETDYFEINNQAKSYNVEVLNLALEQGKGIRILKQDIFETVLSFIISQNNNIPRIKGIIEKLCIKLGEKKKFRGVEYFNFPTVEKLAEQDLDFYLKIGLGYRAKYIKNLVDSVKNGLDLYSFQNLTTDNLKKTLLSIYGIGPKVADCIIFFAYGRSDSFPVDTWIEKVYREHFNGTLTDRKKIASYFVEKFGKYSGYVQQYLFYYKRQEENKSK